ncbi:MAG: F0F1 ATP synthase subunit delta [Rickettsiales bacterium]|nr:F0F1 ATP synthase subunit delta [Rickettsiales bacterium]
MLSLTDRARIVNSYSTVLTDILSSRTDFEEVLNGLKACAANDIFNCLHVSPANVKEYRKLLKEMLSHIDVGDTLQKFIFTLLSRRYLNLFGEIVSATEHKMRKQLKRNTITVLSSKELSRAVKDEIAGVVEKKVGKGNNIIYRIDARVHGDTIELRANGNVCVLNIMQLVQNVFDVKEGF